MDAVLQTQNLHTMTIHKSSCRLAHTKSLKIVLLLWGASDGYCMCVCVCEIVLMTSQARAYMRTCMYDVSLVEILLNAL